MLYISAQPDTIYFVWQLEIQLRNFNSLGIRKEDIQVLIGYDKDLGLRPKFKDFLAANDHLALFYLYPDLRTDPKYTSSIRPNILKQHFTKYPYLEFAKFMYHDSDILLSRIPQIQDVKDDETCIVSDTRNYLDINYIRRVGSEQLLDEMLNVVGLPKDILEKEDSNTGGAQYILSGISANFWEKIESDCERLFVLMKDFNTESWEKDYPLKKEYRSKKKGIQAWCADMWAVLWNLWLANRKVEIHKEMDFSWPYDAREKWSEKAIQHYSGNVEDSEKYFKKIEYTNYMPWYDNKLTIIPDNTCSYEIVKLIEARKNELYAERSSFPATVILLETKFADLEVKKTFDIHQAFIQKYLDIRVFLLVENIHNESYKENEVVLKNNLYQFIEDFANCRSFIVIPLHSLLKIDKLTTLISIPFTNQSFVSRKQYKIDMLFNEAFSKLLEVELFEENIGKFNTMECERPVLKLDSEQLSLYQNNLQLKTTLELSTLKETYHLP